MSRSKKDLERLATTVYDEMLAGATDDEIMDVTGLTPAEYQPVKRFMLEQRGALERARTPEERFAEYKIAMARNKRDLDDLVRNLDGKAQYNAVLGAIRLRSEIQRGEIEMGQTLGVIPKQAERKEIIAGVLVADMSDKELRAQIMEQTKLTAALSSRFGDGDLMSLEAGPTHYGKALSEAVEVEAEGA